MVELTENLITNLKQLVDDGGFYDRAKLELLDSGFHDDNLNAIIALLPKSTEQACKILRFCYSNDISIVPQGGRAGLAGGCVNNLHQVILMTDRLDKVIEIDPMERITIVEAGVTLQELDNQLKIYDLCLGVDLGARGTATIGGMIGTNAGGMEAFRNGSMRQRVLGLTAVLPNGSLFEDMSRVPKCNEGYDIKQLFCGAEGTLGLVTSAVLKLESTTSNTSTLFAAVLTASAAISIFRCLQTVSEVELLRAELMWNNYAQCIAKELGLERVLEFCDAPFYVIYELGPLIKETDLDEILSTSLEPLMENGELIDLVIARNERERDEIWCIREDSFVIDRCLNYSLWYDVSVPLSQLDTYVNEVKNKLYELDPEIQSYFMGHLGDGNLHATIGTHEEISIETKKSISAIVEGSLKRIGGSFSAEHGIGTDKRESLKAYANPENLKLMSLIKNAVDPKGLMNPGKIL